MAYATWALTYTLKRHYTCTSTKGTRNVRKYKYKQNYNHI